LAVSAFGDTLVLEGPDGEAESEGRAETLAEGGEEKDA
jgi:hypothetical protein